MGFMFGAARDAGTKAFSYVVVLVVMAAAGAVQCLVLGGKLESGSIAGTAFFTFPAAGFACRGLETLESLTPREVAVRSCTAFAISLIPLGAARFVDDKGGAAGFCLPGSYFLLYVLLRAFLAQPGERTTDEKVARGVTSVDYRDLVDR